jgi:TRAP-type C4-dicarboxylate transport system permease small subunit
MKTDFTNKAERSIKRVAKIFNDIAGWAIVAAMVLVVLNVLLRAIFGKPILGTYEFTGFLTAVIVGFGIAFCLVLDAHISIDFLTEKLPKKVQNILGTVTNSLMFVLMSVFTYYIFQYATKLLKSNSVSATTQFPYYIIVYIIGVCFVVLSLVLLTKVKDCILEAKKNES